LGEMEGVRRWIGEQRTANGEQKEQTKLQSFYYKRLLMRRKN